MGGHVRTSAVASASSFKGLEREGGIMTVWIRGNKNFPLEGLFFPFAAERNQIASSRAR
jgi:hypothetical protein